MIFGDNSAATVLQLSRYLEIADREIDFGKQKK